MKNFVTTFFMVAFCLQIFSKPFIVADYLVNTAAYAENCENKAKPQLQCHGKCQMMKKLAAEEKKDEDDPARKGENKSLTIVFSGPTFNMLPLPGFSYLSLNEFPPASTGHPVDRSVAIFHPPSA